MAKPILKIEQIEDIPVSKVTGLQPIIDNNTVTNAEKTAIGTIPNKLEASDLKTVGGQSIVGTGDIEVTTTIADGSITEAKLSTAVQTKLNRVTSSSEINWVNLTADYTLTLEDKGAQFINQTATDYEITIPANATVNFATDFDFACVQTSTGRIAVKGATGVTIQPVRTTTADRPMVISRFGVDNYISLGTKENYTPVVIPTNLYTLLNAAGQSDTNATTGFVANGNVTVESVADGGQNAILINRLAGGGFTNGATTLTGLIDGASYTVVVRARKDAANVANPVMQIWNAGGTGTVTPSSTAVTTSTYTDYTINVILGGTTSLLMYFYPTDDANVNDKIYIQSIIITLNA